MKKLIFIVFTLFIVSLSYSQEIEFYKNSRNEKHIAGEFPIDYLKKDSIYSSWFIKNYENFTPKNLNKVLKKGLKKMHVDVYLGTWCGDSKNWVPKFLKTWDEIGLKRSQLKFIALYDTTEKYKQGPNAEEKGKQIHRVPTFIFKENNKEVARIVEYPRNDLVTDLTQIAYKIPSKPSYLGANYIMKYLEEKSLKDFYKDLNKQYQDIYQLIGKSKELNTLGYVYLRSKRIDEALIVFQLNTYYFPNNPNVFESYAEALEVKGDIKNAILNYKIVYKLDTKNTNAAEKIKQLQKKLPKE